MISLSASLAAGALFATGALAVPSPASVGSDLQILLHNDLYGDESSRTDAVIVLGTPETQAAAATACAALGEKLWTPPADLSSDNFLAYLAYQAGATSQPAQWGPWKTKRGYPPPVNSPHGGPPGGGPWGPPHGPPHGPPFEPYEQLYYIAGSGAHGECQAITPNAQVVSVPCTVSLPALCTQTAPLSSINSTDTSSQYQTQVSSGSATYTGYRDALSFRFLGIKYGTYPERFTYSSVYNNTGNVSALEFGAICRQVDAITNVNDGSEDCLHINIYTPYLPDPTDKAPALKPVMFWIHGGGYGNGYGSDPTFDGGNLASRGDVVLVSINYRLGTFGFLALNETGINGNFGIGDQVTALQWVHDNIAAFGGNASQVTIFGQSAGAGSVRALLQSPPVEGLIAGAILQSDLGISSYNHYLTIDQEIASQTNSILNETGCASGNGAAELACLRAYNASGLTALATKANNVIVDGTYVVSPAIVYNGTSHVNKVPLLIGNMRDDGAPFISYIDTTSLNASLVANGIAPGPVLANVEDFPLPTSANATLNVYNVTAEVQTDEWFECSDKATAYAATLTHTLPEVYYYEFNRSYQIPYWPPAPLKALCNAPITPSHPGGDPSGEYFKCHSGDLMLVFSTWRRWGLPSRDDNDTPFTQTIVDTWTAWARTFEPTPAAGYLAARGYTNTTATLAAAGAWPAVMGNTSQTERWLQAPGLASIPFREETQCAALGVPLDYFFLPGV